MSHLLATEKVNAQMTAPKNACERARNSSLHRPQQQQPHHTTPHTRPHSARTGERDARDLSLTVSPPTTPLPCVYKNCTRCLCVVIAQTLVDALIFPAPRRPPFFLLAPTPEPARLPTCAHTQKHAKFLQPHRARLRDWRADWKFHARLPNSISLR